MADISSWLYDRIRTSTNSTLSMRPRLRSIAAALDAIASRHGFKIVFLPFHDGAENDNIDPPENRGHDEAA